jgi:hypothetical protein
MRMKVARGLGWFSLGLGITEIVAGKQLGRALGMEGRAWLLRIYRLREIAAGVGIFSKKHPAPWVWARVAGDVLDIATVAAAYTKDSPKKENVAAAFQAQAIRSGRLLHADDSTVAAERNENGRVPGTADPEGVPQLS